MSYYITPEQQLELYNLMNRYLALSQNGEVRTRHSDKLAAEMFTGYIDKIINGVIYANKKKFYKHGDTEAIFQEARIAVLSSIHKRQWDPQKGTIFNFFTTVVTRNLTNYTTRASRKRRGGEVDVEYFQNTLRASHTPKYETAFTFSELTDLLVDYFDNSPGFQKLCYELVDYFLDHRGERFTKRAFSTHAESIGFHPTYVSTFFSMLRRAKKGNQNIGDFFLETIICYEERFDEKYRCVRNKNSRGADSNG